TNLYTRNAIRSFFPCWDNPTITAIFNISINHPIYYTVFSNMPILRTTEELQGVRWTYFRETPSMSIYLLAIVIISNITTYTSYQGINSMWFQTDIWKTFKYAHNIAYSATVYLSAYTNIRTLSVFEKLNYIIVPNGLNGMISAGGRQLVLYREEDIKYDEASNYFGRNISVTTLVAYEVARQWFVGFVSLKLENDIWINEILASFYSYYITAQVIPSFVLIHMLHHLLTPEIFQQAIEEYVKVSRTYNLWTIMQKYYNHENKSRYTIKEIIDSWLTTKYYPVLSIQSNNRRRIICYTFDNSDDLAKWKIPINYITKSNLTSYNITNIIWFGQKQMDIINDIDRDDFYILNVGQIGLYRVNYDYRNWLMISSYLQFDKYLNIPVLNRAQLISDSYYYAVKGELDSFVFIDIIRYLKRETNYIGWYPMFNILDNMSVYLNYLRANATVSI
ncbi:Glutamyl aminopeptidase, partial [Harpegnathos saltator]